MTNEEAIFRFNESNAIIHDIVQFGGGGFTLRDVRSLPIYLRRFHYYRLVENNKKQQQVNAPKGVVTESDFNTTDLKDVLKKFEIPEDTYTVKKKAQ